MSSVEDTKQIDVKNIFDAFKQEQDILFEYRQFLTDYIEYFKSMLGTLYNNRLFTAEVEQSCNYFQQSFLMKVLSELNENFLEDNKLLITLVFIEAVGYANQALETHKKCVCQADSVELAIAYSVRGAANFHLNPSIESIRIDLLQAKQIFQNVIADGGNSSDITNWMKILTEVFNEMGDEDNYYLCQEMIQELLGNTGYTDNSMD